MGFTRVRDVQQEKLQELKHLRKEIQNIHEKVLQSRPKSLDEYIKKMQDQQIKVIPSINKSNQLQGFRFKYNNSFTKLKEAPQTIQLLSSTVQLSTGMIKK